MAQYLKPTKKYPLGRVKRSDGRVIELTRSIDYHLKPARPYAISGGCDTQGNYFLITWGLNAFYQVTNWNNCEIYKG